MTRDQVNRAIAMYFEPMPTERLIHPDTYGWQSRKRFWRFIENTATEFHWESNYDFYTDESASAMLLEAMPMPQLWLEDSDPRLWACWADMEASPEVGYGHHPDRKTAVVLAFCKFAGIEGGD